jgi:4-hydroxybenzoate polyprenyltransferase
MPFALIGFFLATKSNEFEWMTLLYVVFCMIFARSAAMAFNRYIDRDIDAANSRTAEVREIPNGSIKANSALIFVIINSLLFVTTTYLITSLCLALSPIAILVILGYSYTKRFTALCHLILGLGLELSPIGAYIAVSGEFNIIPLLFSAAILLWVSGFDIIYSLQDQEFDKEQKLHSVPVLIGTKNALNLSKILHFLTFSTLIIAGSFGDFSFYYWIGFGIFTTLLIYQHLLVKHSDLSKINLAFFTTNGIASIIFGAFVIFEILIQ